MLGLEISLDEVVISYELKSCGVLRSNTAREECFGAKVSVSAGIAMLSCG